MLHIAVCKIRQAADAYLAVDLSFGRFSAQTRHLPCFCGFATTSLVFFIYLGPGTDIYLYGAAMGAYVLAILTGASAPFLEWRRQSSVVVLFLQISYCFFVNSS
jgi:hypothetical protein